MVGDAPYMFLCESFPFRSIRGVDIIRIRLKTELGVYHHFRIIRIIHYHVRNHPSSTIVLHFMSILVPDNSLRTEMHPFLQSGFLKEIHQQHFSEIALHLGTSFQCFRQIPGLISHTFGLIKKLLEKLP